MEGLNVNLGCQIHHFDGWVNQDVVTDDPNIRTEWKCDANNLPTGDGTVDHIYAGHLVEHFYPDTIESYIREWHRVLKKGGELLVVTPDFGMMARGYASGQFTMSDLMQPAFGRIYHYDRPEERHHILFDDERLGKYLACVEWERSEPVNLQKPPSWIAPFMDTHVSRSNLQLAYLFVK